MIHKPLKNVPSFLTLPFLSTFEGETARMEFLQPVINSSKLLNTNNHFTTTAFTGSSKDTKITSILSNATTLHKTYQKRSTVSPP
jgi:hypothetical protein